MHKYNFCYLLILSSAFGGCATSYHVEDNQQVTALVEMNSTYLPEGKFFVTNKNLVDEYAIFKQSGRFPESEFRDEAVEVTLYPMAKLPSCGNPLIASAVFLGTLPVSLPNDAEYSFSTNQNGKIQSFHFMLRAYSRISIWEWFLKPFNSEHEVYAEALKVAEFR